MLNTPAYILLTLYSAIIVASYIVVRRGWLRAYPTFVFAGVTNALVAFAFSVMRGNMLLQAVIVGPITGMLFVAVSVTIASLFRDTQPSYADMRASIGQLGIDNSDHNSAFPELPSAQPEVGELIALHNF
jgi:hypothetical protein